MRKFLLLLLALLLVPAAYVGAMSYARADLSALPPLESGDLIFETAINSQTLPIVLATGSLYDHVGIIHKQHGGYTVIQAQRHVAETSLADFARLGWGQRITVLRYPGLSDAQREAIVQNAESYLGRGYNFVFYMKSPDIYCSELPYLAYQSQNLPLGHVQKIGELNMNNPPVHTLFNARWHMHPACQAPGMTADACWKAVLDEPIITPVSLARDAKLTPIYSNYLF